jgi:hypothetical protein
LRSTRGRCGSLAVVNSGCGRWKRASELGFVSKGEHNVTDANVPLGKRRRYHVRELGHFSSARYFSGSRLLELPDPSRPQSMGITATSVCRPIGQCWPMCFCLYSAIAAKKLLVGFDSDSRMKALLLVCCPMPLRLNSRSPIALMSPFTDSGRAQLMKRCSVKVNGDEPLSILKAFSETCCALFDLFVPAPACADSTRLPPPEHQEVCRTSEPHADFNPKRKCHWHPRHRRSAQRLTGI